jgi:shikimate dehydrogenase
MYKSVYIRQQQQIKNGAPILKKNSDLLLGLIGFPLGHSISPQIHARLFQLAGIEAKYSLFEIKPEKFDSQAAFFQSLDGFNVTIPYKRRILPLLDRMDSRAQRCGAVNTVKCKDGVLYGFNTDAEGFLRALDVAGISLHGRILLCGAGGAARMMACEALEHGCSLVVATRDGVNARTAQDDLLRIFPSANICAQKLSEVDGFFDLILNGTPSGMYPDVNGCPVARHVIKGSAAVFDAVYNPFETVLVKTARAAGAKAAGGLAMLILQAAAAEEIWADTRFDMNCLETLCEDMSELIRSRYIDKPDGKL